MKTPKEQLLKREKILRRLIKINSNKREKLVEPLHEVLREEGV